MTRTVWNFASAGQLVFGPGAVRQVGPQAARRGLRRALLITDHVLQELGIVDRVEDSCRAAGVACEIFAEGQPEPSLEVAEAAIAAARTTNPDLLIGLGGGSNLDLAKITAIAYRYGGSPRDYFGFDRVPGPVVPLIGVPTTAGTGSEVSHAAVVTDTAQQIKVSTLSHYLRPVVAIVDPELTYSCPPRVTAESGIDALTHAIEAYTATDYRALDVPADEPFPYEGCYPLGASLAETAVQFIGRHLVTAVHEPQNAAARDGMALAATLAGLAFSNCGVALVHALEYPLGGAVHCSHGAGNGLLLPYVLRFNLPERIPELARIATLLGVVTRGLSPAAAAAAAIDRIARLREEIGIPLRIRDLGATREQLPEFAARAFAVKRLLTVNPRRATEADLLAIYEAAF